MAKLAFLGLGVMGAPMAGHLQKAGHDVTVYNRTAAKAEDWVKTYGGAMAKSPAEAAAGADFCSTVLRLSMRESPSTPPSSIICPSVLVWATRERM